MFLGSFKTFFNAKNRLVLPKKIRNELSDLTKFYVILGEDGEIWGFDQKNWESLTVGVLASSLSSLEGRYQRRKIFALAEVCELDSQGRFILPTEFVAECGLEDEVVIVGAGDHFEIWDKKAWERIRKDLKK